MFDRTPPDDLDVRVTELLVATPDAADPVLSPQVKEVLALLRERMQMDLAFVSQFEGGRQIFRRIDQAADLDLPEGHTDPLEDSWCQRVVDGRVPELIPEVAALVAAGRLPPPKMPVGTYISTPVVLGDGRVYGTLCCISRTVRGNVGEADLKRLRATANLLAVKLEAARAGSAAEAITQAPAWSLEPKQG